MEPRLISATDRQSLLRDGYLHCREILTPPQLDEMRSGWTRLLEQAVSGEPAFTSSRGNNDGPRQLEQEAAFRICLEHPVVMAAVAFMLDDDVHLLSFRGRNPSRGSGQQALHVDAAGPTPADKQSAINAFWLLDDMDERNGATRVVPGSHRFERIPDKRSTHRDAIHREAQFLPGRAGDVIVFSAHLWHAGSKNESGANRRVAMAQFGRHAALAGYAVVS